jgi:hypothetical protein
MPWIVFTTSCTPLGATSAAARRSALLNDPLRRLPESPINVIILAYTPLFDLASISPSISDQAARKTFAVNACVSIPQFVSRLHG